MKYNRTNLKRVVNRANKLGINISNIMKGRDVTQIVGGAIKSTIKSIQRAIERPKILEEINQYEEKFKEKKRENELRKMLKEHGFKAPKGKIDTDLAQNFLNDKFLEKYPQFKPVFKYDKKYNQSGSAEITARNYMKAQKKYLIEDIFNQFDDVSPKLKDELTKMINSIKFDIDAIRDMETIAQNLIYKQDSDYSEEVEIIMNEFGEDVGTHDNFIERLIVRFRRIKPKEV